MGRHLREAGRGAGASGAEVGAGAIFLPGRDRDSARKVAIEKGWMAKKPQLDVRKLKDEVAESLKKQKWERAADVLEQLIALEPKDMSHRLKLGDAYRHLEQPAKAIAAYQYAASFFGDEGQLIKAIGAVKIILEIDPRNSEAQAHLQQMNERRFGKVALGKVGLKRTAAATAQPQAAPPTAAIELDPPLEADDAPLQAGDDEPLELDDGLPSRPAARLPQRGFNPGAPRGVVSPARPRNSIDLEKGIELDSAELQPDESDDDAEALPDDAILTPQAEDLIPEENDQEVLPEEDEPFPGAEDEPEDEELRPAAAPPPSIPLPKKKAARPLPKVVKPPPRVEDEIVLDDEPPRPGRKAPAARGKPRPIADLLSSAAEEEVELLSISSDEELVGEPPGEDPEVDADLDDAFDKVASIGEGAPRKLPTKKVPLFDDLSQAAFVELVNRLGYQRHMPGELIIREGDPGSSFFIIVEGKVRIFKLGADEREITLAHLGEGAFFGEMALLSGAPRTANVVAEEETEILEVTDVVLRELAEKHPQVIRSLKNFYRQRLLNNVMAISPLFKDFDPAERKSIVEKFRMKQADDGEVLIAEDTNSDGLYVVLHGGVQVARNDGPEPVELARLKEGDIFGEMSLLTRQPATATVTSVGSSILLRLPRESFQELVVTHPQILELVSELTERRKGETDASL